VRLPRNAAYCAAWNSGFLTTFSWSSGSRNARGELAHSDAGVKKIPVDAHARKKSCHNCTALTSACLLSLKGSVASFWLCADDFRSSPTRRQFQSPSGLRICAISRRAILFDHAKLSLTAKGNDLLSQGPFQEDTRLLTRRHNRATQIRLRFISISRSRRKLRPRTVRRL
jgi:hypothetical protein